MFSELNQYSNPLSKSFLERHWNTLYSMNLAGNISEYAMSEIDPVQRLFSKITETIQDDVVQLLGPTKYKLDTLEIWNEVANDPDISCLHIYSLNHDLLLEKLFHKNETIYNDGFEIKSIVRCPVWNRNLFKSDDYKVHLYKLHGSIGWTFTRINGNEAFCRYPIDESSCSLDCPQKIKGICSPFQRPEILVGTYDKMLEYTHDIYLDMFHLLYKRLIDMDTKNLIICGYGFGDIGINNILHYWIGLPGIRKAIVIEPDIDGMLNRASPSISKRWKDLIETGRFVKIPKGIHEIDWQCVKSKLADNN